MTSEIAYAPDFAYHIDYIIRNKVEDLPEPEVKLFAPSNYLNDYIMSFDKGIAKIISDIVSYN